MVLTLYCPKHLLTYHVNMFIHLFLQVLIDHVCAFTERNQVTWVDLHKRPIEFNRSAILMEVMITMECYLFKEKYLAMQDGREAVDRVDNPYYLLATFDAIMNTMAKANGKKVSRIHFYCYNSYVTRYISHNI